MAVDQTILNAAHFIIKRIIRLKDRVPALR